MAVNNSLMKKDDTKDTKTSFSVFLTKDSVKNKINEIVGGKDGQLFMTSILSAVTNNEALQECDQMSILNCAFLGQALKLSPSPQLGQYYMVPFNNTKRNIKEAQFQLGYKGYIQLAIRSGYYKKINVLAIKEGELIKYDPLNEEIEVNLIEDEEIRECAPTIGYYAMFEYENGFRKTMYWSKKKMLIHADKYSQSFSVKAKKGKEPKYDKVSYEDYEAGNVKEFDMWKYSSFWYKDFDAMAYKTMLRQLISKWGIMSIEMQKAFESDMAVIQDDMKPNYVDNTPENVIEVQQIEEKASEEIPVEEPKDKTEQEPNGLSEEFFN